MIERGDRYSRGAIAFHWTIAALVIANLLIGLFHEGAPRAWNLIPIHKSIGILVLLLSIGRLGWRLTHRPPSLPSTMPTWERLAAKSVHWLFYVLIIVLPLSGWAFGSNPARPRPATFFWLFDLPLLPVTTPIAQAAREAHELLGYLMAALVVIHIAAALRHQFLLRDTIASRMLPRAKQRN
ncbi:cytochrome b [Sphingomonas sp.]|uniref:cytochrome b n=1 Tax=Sphingomonas sp. TaxID=28214 RepID=UPI001AFED981|nr:cytochrome b [Sphingomonas sp.]MBO9714656.1 cytochrome b [Sphingomonas sp.]